jgi:putative transposase
MLDQFRWYYNATLTTVYNHYGHDKITAKNKYSSYTVRDLLRKYEYTEEQTGNLLLKDFVYNEDRDEIPVPEWWEGNVHSRLPRGASGKFVSSLNSAISNYKNGNTRGFKMKFRSKRSPTDYLNFEDAGFPVFIKKIKSRYWFTTRNRKRKTISFSDIDTQARGIEIIYEKATGKYFLHYPVERNWFPTDDRRNDNQVRLSSQEDRVISLDPGVRKFLVGYDPKGNSIFIGEGAQQRLISLLYRIDKMKLSSVKTKLWKKVRNLICELHWKSISFLVKNYDVILLPDFRVSQMLRKKKIGRMTKRLLSMFSFFRFKQKLKWKCDVHGKKLVIVDESYTSKTCTRCGKLNDVGGKEVFNCRFCGLEVDRDVVGSRNIFIKNITLR